MISKKYFIPGLIIVIILLYFYPEIITSCMQKAPSIEVKFEVDASSSSTTSITNNSMLSQTESVKQTAQIFAEVNIKLLKACTETVDSSGVKGQAKVNGVLECVELLTKNMPK